MKVCVHVIVLYMYGMCPILYVGSVLERQLYCCLVYEKVSVTLALSSILPVSCVCVCLCGCEAFPRLSLARGGCVSNAFDGVCSGTSPDKAAI